MKRTCQIANPTGYRSLNATVSEKQCLQVLKTFDTWRKRRWCKVVTTGIFTKTQKSQIRQVTDGARNFARQAISKQLQLLQMYKPSNFLGQRAA